MLDRRGDTDPFLEGPNMKVLSMHFFVFLSCHLCAVMKIDTPYTRDISLFWVPAWEKEMKHTLCVWVAWTGGARPAGGRIEAS